MIQTDDTEGKHRLIKMVIDAFFDPGALYSEELKQEVAFWLMDREDGDIKDRVLRAKFDEIVDDGNISMTGEGIYSPVSDED